MLQCPTTKKGAIFASIAFTTEFVRSKRLSLQWVLYEFVWRLAMVGYFLYKKFHYAIAMTLFFAQQLYYLIECPSHQLQSSDVLTKRDIIFYNLYKHLTCNGITIIKTFLSLSAIICFMNVQPVPISTIVINNTAPFNLSSKNELQKNI